MKGPPQPKVPAEQKSGEARTSARDAARALVTEEDDRTSDDLIRKAAPPKGGTATESRKALIPQTGEERLSE